ncbi:hypothetical protein D6833_06820 [Candidatus Parcubacteria bacterium]|nr:MAG: hypothetical protein D6833_06820 [Candidatus Parcubacteria bacterium]
MWAVNGYQMLFAVLIKPSLMVLLLFAASIVSSLGVLVMAKVFDTAGITTLLTDAGTFNVGSIFMAALLMFLFGWITLQIVMKSYSIIITGPDKIVDLLGWKVLQSDVADTEGRVSAGSKALADGAATGGNAAVEGHFRRKSRAPESGDEQPKRGPEPGGDPGRTKGDIT